MAFVPPDFTAQAMPKLEQDSLGGRPPPGPGMERLVPISDEVVTARRN